MGHPEDWHISAIYRGRHMEQSQRNYRHCGVCEGNKRFIQQSACVRPGLEPPKYIEPCFIRPVNHDFWDSVREVHDHWSLTKEVNNALKSVLGSNLQALEHHVQQKRNWGTRGVVSVTQLPVEKAELWRQTKFEDFDLSRAVDVGIRLYMLRTYL